MNVKLFLLPFVLILGLAAPAASQDDAKATARLEKHLAALSSGAPMEEYVAEQFKRAGLKPALPRGDYTQEFEGGSNVLALVPGQHPQFRDQYILVVVNDPREAGSGRPARGASTGAAPNAVLLSAGEMLARHPCQRSLLLVSSNPTEKRGKGADYLLSHLPVPAEQIVACVVLGSLGRAYADFMNGVVWTAGLEYCPELDELVANATAEAGLYVLPAAADVLDLPSVHDSFIRRRIPALLFSGGEHADSGLDSDRAALLDTLTLARFSRYLAALLRNLADAPTTPQCRPEPVPLLSEFCSYAVECGVLVTLEAQGRLRLQVGRELVESASRLRGACIDLCEKDPLPKEEAREVQKQARALNQQLVRAVRQRRGQAPEPALADLGSATPAPELSEFAPQNAAPPRQDARKPGPDFVIPEGGIEVVDITAEKPPATPEVAPLMPPVHIEAVAPVRIVEPVRLPASAEIASVTRTLVIRPATAEASVRPKAAAARIAPGTRQAAPAKAEDKKPGGQRYLKPPSWLAR